MLSWLVSFHGQNVRGVTPSGCCALDSKVVWLKMSPENYRPMLVKVRPRGDSLRGGTTGVDGFNMFQA